MRLFILVSVFVLITLPAHAAQNAKFSGAYLIQVCSMDKNGKEIVPGGHNACQSYISGVIDYHNTLKALGTAPATDFCIPAKESLVEIQKFVLFYLLKYKTIHSEFVAAPAVNLALNTFYPCGKRKK